MLCEGAIDYVHLAGQRAIAAEHLNECPKRKDRFPISVFLLAALCYAFLGQEDSHPHEKSH